MDSGPQWLQFWHTPTRATCSGARWKPSSRASFFRADSRTSPGASYTVPHIDVLLSASVRSLIMTPAATGNVATNGASLAANYVVPNTVIQQSLGRLPANALATGTTTLNLMLPGQLYTLQRMTLVDFRVAKIMRAGGRRVDLGVDLYNVLNTNFATAYEQTYEYRTNGAAWLQPTSIAAPRLARLHLTLSF